MSADFLKLRRRGRRFQFRQRVPKDLASFFPRSHIEVSLHTEDFSQAERRATRLRWAFESTLARMRLPGMTNREIQDIAKRFIQDTLAFTEELRTSKPDHPLVLKYQAANLDMIQAEIDDLKQALGKNDVNTAKQFVSSAQKLYHFEVEPDTDPYRRLCREMLKAAIQVVTIEMERAQGNYDNPYDNFLTSTLAEEEAQNAMTLQEAVDSFMEANSFKWNSKRTWHEYSAIFELMCAFIGPKTPVASITNQVFLKMRAKLAKIPPNMTKVYPDMTPEQVIKLPDIKRISKTTLDNKLTKIAQFFKWCERLDYVHKSPAFGWKSVRDKRSKDKKRKPYTDDELTLIASKLAEVIERPEEKPERVWVPLIGMYTGARLDEICQLYVSDIKCSEDGIWYFDINDDGDKKLKAHTSAKRLVPIHPILIEAGILSFTAYQQHYGSPRLWMRLKTGVNGYSTGFSRWYNARFNRVHITKDPQKVFHSYRNTWITRMKQLQIPFELIDEIDGHSHQGEGLRTYADSYRIDVLHKEISKLEYGADLSPLIDACKVTFPRQFAKQMPQTQKSPHQSD